VHVWASEYGGFIYNKIVYNLMCWLVSNFNAGNLLIVE